MTAISSVSSYTPPPAASAVRGPDPDQDGDNDAGKSAASEAKESTYGSAVKVSLSSQAQALLAQR